MNEALNLEVGRWDWKAQRIGEGDDQDKISDIISRLERGFYKTKKVKLSLEIYNLRNQSFDCPNLFQFLTHYKLVSRANLDYPVIINNEGQVIDGRHRICKAILLGKKSIKAIQILDSSVI